MDKRKYRKTELVYLGVTIFSGIFSLVYEHYSHGVYSSAMIFMFLYPLLGGVMPFLLLSLGGCPYPGRISLNLYNTGIALFTLGSCLKGIFEIYGNSSDYVFWYYIAGGIFVVAGGILYAVSVKIK